MADRDIITDDRGISAAVNMNAAVILYVGVRSNEYVIIVATHRYLMPDAAVCADSNGTHDGGCRRNKYRILNLWNEVQKGSNVGLAATVTPIVAIVCHCLPPVIARSGKIESPSGLCVGEIIHICPTSCLSKINCDVCRGS